MDTGGEARMDISVAVAVEMLRGAVDKVEGMYLELHL